MSKEGNARTTDLFTRAGRRISSDLATATTLAILVSTVAVPPQLTAQPARAQDTPLLSGDAQGPELPDTSEVEVAFLDEVTQLGLTPVGVAAVSEADNGTWTIVLGATAPLGRPETPAFFMRRTAAVAVSSEGKSETLATSDLVLRYAGDHATVELVDRFSDDFSAGGRASGLAGLEIRHTAEVDIPNLEALASASRASGGAGQTPLSDLLQRGDLEYGNYREHVTVTRPDGQVETYAAGQFDLSEVLGEGSGAGAIDCIRKCFSEAGGDIGLLTVVCIISGAAVCAVGCAVTVGVACIPCILTVGGVCGTVIPTAGAAVCTAQCLFPGTQLPTPTRTRTRTPTSTRTATATVRAVGCVGDCDQDGQVTVDEILNAIAVALGTVSIDRCTRVDTNHDGRVTVDEILTATNFALNGCVL